MTKQIAYFLIIISLISLVIDFYVNGFNFDKSSRVFRNISSIMLIILGVSSLMNLKK